MLLLGFLLASISVQEPAPSSSHSSPRPQIQAHLFTQNFPKVDGDLSEWRGLPSIKLNRKEQLNHFPGDPISQNWAGPQDCSAEIYFGYSESDFWVAGEITDDAHVDPAELWWGADAVELFLCTNPKSNEPAGFDADDYQIFIMPFRAGQRWGVWTHKGVMAPTEAGFVGVEVQGKRNPNTGGYTFEAVFPWVNFPEFPREPKFILANIAIDDGDQAGLPVKNYMVWTEDDRVYLDARKMGKLEFPQWPAVVAPADLIRDKFLNETFFFLFTLAGLALLFSIARWIYRSFGKKRNLLRWLVLLACIFLGVSALTALLRFAIGRQAQSSLAPAAARLNEVLDSIAQGSIGRVGSQQGENLIDLLAGKPVSPNPQIQYSILPFPPSRLQKISGKEEIPFLRYDISLDGSEARVLHFSGKPLAEKLAFAVAIEGAAGSERESPILSLDLSSCKKRSTLQESAHFEFSLRSSQSLLWKGSQDKVEFFELDLKDERELVRAECRVSGLQGRKLKLQGISRLSKGEWLEAPLRFSSLTGVPTNFEAANSVSSGILLPPTEANNPGLQFEFHEQTDRLWFFAAIESEAVARETPYGAPILEIYLQNAEGLLEKTILRKDVDLHHFNLDLSPHRSDMQSQTAFQWEQNGTRFHTDVREIRIPGSAKVETISFRNVTANGVAPGYPVRLCGLTAGRAAVMKLPTAESPIEVTKEGLHLKPEAQGIFQGTEFAFFSAEGLQQSSNASKDSFHRLTPEQIEAVIQKGQALELGIYGRIVPVRENDRVIGALSFSRLQPAFVSWLRIAGLLPFICLVLLVPFLLFALADAMSKLGRVRNKLFGAFLLTSIVPLSLLLFFLSDLILHRYRSAEEDRLLAALSVAEQKIYQRRDEASQAASAFARAFMEHSRVRELLMNPDQPNYQEQLQKELRSMRNLVAGAGSWGFVRFEDYEPQGTSYRKRVTYEGRDAEEFANLDVFEAGLYESHGRLVAAGVQRVQEGQRRFVFVIGEELHKNVGDDFLFRLYARRGYPLHNESSASFERSPKHLQELTPLFEGLAQTGERRVQTLSFEDGSYQCALSALKDSDGGPVAFLAIGQPQTEYLLNLGITQIPLTRALILFGCVLIVSAFVVVQSLTSRITKPIEKLQGAAKNLQKESYVVPIQAESRDEVGQLTRSFNEMAESLRQRFFELSQLNAGMRQMSLHLETEFVVSEALHLLCEAPGVDRAFVVLKDSGRDSVQWIGQDARTHVFEDLDEWLKDAMSLEALSPLPPFALIESPSVYGVPLFVRTRKLGIVLIGSPRALDSAEKEFLKAAAGQIAIALENARLYQLAIEDETTGAYNGSYFRARLSQEIDAARAEGRALSLLRISLRGLDPLLQKSNLDEQRKLLEEIGTRLRSGVPRHAILGRAGLGDFHLLLTNVPKEEALKFADVLLQSLVSASLQKNDGSPIVLRPQISVASFPQDGPSADFILHLLDPRRSGIRRSASRVYDVQQREDSVRFETDQGEVVFRSPQMLQILSTIERIAPGDLPVLLEGETGVGKEVLADIIHQQSGRGDRPFIKINCAALPENLVESEFFGYEKGAFTGATARKSGFFELANGGTLFLDEVGELSPAIQAKFLRVLQEKKITRLGGNSTVEADVRILAATNRDLLQAVSLGRFRSDLYYRLHGISILIPPLRERREEIPELVSLCLARWKLTSSKKVRGIQAATLDLLYKHSWPGNLRELIHVLQRAYLLCDGEEISNSDIQLEPVVLQENVITPDLSPIESSANSLNERQVRLIRQLVDKEVITTIEYVSMASVSRRTALRDLSELVEKGVLERKGRRRAAEYRLKQFRQNMAN